MNAPERVMARKAFLPAAVVAVLAAGVGYLANGSDAALSAFLGVLTVAGTFALYVFVIGWARSVSLAALQIAVMGGWLVRLGVFVGVLLALRGTEWFDVAAFGLAGIAGALAVAVYETRLWLGGLGEPDVTNGRSTDEAELSASSDPTVDPKLRAQA